jgi:D-serine deaminase-like pyridoxal phosphate-dependent protein
MKYELGVTMTILKSITRPTMLLNEDIAKNNIQRMAAKARAQGIFFRPHFKTHQSAEIGEWYRQAGVTAITNSSIEMAQYFATHGWDDITIAFPVNIRQMDEINSLAQSIRLGLLVDSEEIVRYLSRHVTSPVRVWIEVDTGMHRSGIPCEAYQKFEHLINLLQQHPDQLKLSGLLTHAGHTYQLHGTEQVAKTYTQSVADMLALRSRLESATGMQLKVSVGDTPGCSLSEDLGKVDEIRPGNFIFYDAQMLSVGACQPNQMAVVVACPVVAKYPERSEIVVYGGAVHLSKDSLMDGDRRIFGLVSHLHNDGWSLPLPGAYVRGLSQEHGILHIPAPQIDSIEVGSLIGVVPAHVCLSIAALREFTTLQGRVIPTLMKTSN